MYLYKTYLAAKYQFGFFELKRSQKCLFLSDLFQKKKSQNYTTTKVFDECILTVISV